MSLFSRVQRRAVRGYRGGYASIHSVSVNVNRSGSLIVSRLASVGVFIGSHSRYYSRYLGLDVSMGLVGAYFLCIRGLAAG